MTRPVRIPSDVNRPDRVVGPFTARQAAILAGTAAALYLLWTVVRSLVAAPLFLAGALPVAAAAVVIALGHRDGLSMDRLLIAALRHRFTPRARPTPPPDTSGENRSAAPSSEHVPDWIRSRTTADHTDKPAYNRSAGRGRRPPGLPARTVTAVPGGRGPDRVGVVDLGPDGLLVIALASTVNFALRTPAEQDGLVAGFARYLHALGGPVQILIRALPVDLHTHLHQLRTQLQHLPHPALAAAAHDHLTHLARLAHQDRDNQLLTRQVLLVLREPHRHANPATAPDPQPPAGSEPGGRDPGITAGEHRLLRRLHDATSLLAAIDVSVTALDAAHTTAVLTATCNPDGLNTRGRAADRVVHRSTGHFDNHDNDADPLITGRGRGRTRSDHAGNEGHDGHGGPIRHDYSDAYFDGEAPTTSTRHSTSHSTRHSTAGSTRHLRASSTTSTTGSVVAPAASVLKRDWTRRDQTSPHGPRGRPRWGDVGRRVGGRGDRPHAPRAAG
jgi:hypothetical protein